MIITVKGWGTVGHQAIAQCAQSFLSSSAASSISKMLSIFFIIKNYILLKI